VIDGRQIKLQIWDTAGQERFRTITQAYYRSTQGIIVVYDTNNPTSFTNARHWLEQINQSTGPNIQKALVGNKSDLVRMVQTSEGQALADEYRIPFLECSAKEGENIEQVFMDMGRSIYSERKNNPNRDDTLELSKKKSKYNLAMCCNL